MLALSWMSTALNTMFLFRPPKESISECPILLIYLLQKEKAIIDSIATILQEKALRLYNSFVKNPKSNLSKRCCDFVSLEKASKNYIKTNIYKQED